MSTPRRRVPRVRRAIAGLLALWTLITLVAISAHQAEVGHATLTDGSVVHVGAALAADAHVACREHSAQRTFDVHAAPVTPSDPCSIANVAQPGLHDAPRFDRVLRAIAPEPAAAPAAVAPLASAALLRVAPKTSPPIA